MDSTWIAIILAVLAIALAAFCIYKICTGSFDKSQIAGLDEIEGTASAALIKSKSNAANISLINDQLGAIDEATSGYTSLADSAVQPAFPLALS
jgi:hypothetical protein